MSGTITYTLSAITDKIVDAFSTVNYGELYYKRILAGVYYGVDIIIQLEHLKEVNDIIPTLTKDQLVKVISDAVYNFLERNTAYGFADWAKKEDRLRWRLG